jgi:hypothetical protein
LRKTTFWGSKDLASFIGDTTTYNSWYELKHQIKIIVVVY